MLLCWKKSICGPAQLWVLTALV